MAVEFQQMQNFGKSTKAQPSQEKQGNYLHKINFRKEVLGYEVVCKDESICSIQLNPFQTSQISAFFSLRGTFI